MSRELPAWIDIGVLPMINILMAFLVAGVIVMIVGENPLHALQVLVTGAFGYDAALGYTLYYTTNLIFTGLAVAVAFHAGLFNIGGEGQAYIGGLGVGLAALSLDTVLPGWLVIPIAGFAGGLFGAAWAFIPAWLQAYRGSHIVITTIMFNFLAAALMVHLMVNVIIEPGQMSPQSRELEASAWLPFAHDILGAIGFEVARSPLNLSILWAGVACVFVWLLIWRTRWGYAIRTVGRNERAAVYAGIDPRRVIVGSMVISGMLAGFVGLNEILGVHHRLLLNFTAGYGFTGIAVALMGRGHPIGIVLASLLFGALYQGGTELDFEFQTITRDLVVVIQGLVILFSGALAFMLHPTAVRLWRRYRAQGQTQGRTERTT